MITFYTVIFIIILIIIMHIIIYFYCNKQARNILGAYIDVATGSIHKITKNTVIINNEYHEKNESEIKEKYNFNDLTFEGRKLIPEEEYYTQIINNNIKKANGRYNIATNAFLFINIENNKTVNGIISYDTGDECLIVGEVEIKTLDLIRISGKIILESPTYKNVEYELLDGDAIFNLDIYEDNIILICNHKGYKTKYLCTR